MKPHYSNTINPIDFPKSKNKMNERIKELAEQAETWNADGDKCEVDLEKFAQLIVRECAKSLEEMPRYYKQEGDRQIERDTIFDCMRTIKEHFGVEE